MTDREIELEDKINVLSSEIDELREKVEKFEDKHDENCLVSKLKRLALRNGERNVTKEELYNVILEVER